MRILLTLTLVCLAVVPASAGEWTLGDAFRLLKEEPTLHPDWEGVWESDIRQEECDGTLVDTSVGTDNLCAGEPLLGPDTGTDLTCTGTISSTSIDVSCTGTQEIFTDCVATITVEMQGTRNGDSAEITSTVQATYEGSGFGCSQIPDTCNRIIATSTRTSLEPDCTGVSTHDSSWGTVKARFQ